MTASRFPKRAPRALALVTTLVTALAGAAQSADAQQSGNPGDIIVERTVTPRDAFAPVPRNQDPVAVRATTFPATTFNPMMASVVSDLDLTNAHGSNGVSAGNLNGSEAGLQGITKLLSGSATGSNVAVGANALPQPSVGVGGQISMSVTGALAPLGAALGALK
ncbi:hypothetical protein FAZ69_23175 [Trinickia terrae]|uniref:Uncharacterized protein n=1 Tax=Trinickia terrae TaxID=2571161 RepID=A0A4U1HR35_9BURK|nr:hypothetical protein [Trinickia terrae]TKC83925.1 hypothetical protein FAZ69_23175 [Trinickia terrae]